MSEQQIKEIMNAMAEQNKVLAQLVKDGDERSTALDVTNKKIDSLALRVAPVISLSQSVQGFDRISVWIFKLLLGIAALITALGTILYFIKKLIIGHL